MVYTIHTAMPLYTNLMYSYPRNVNAHQAHEVQVETYKNALPLMTNLIGINYLINQMVILIVF